MQLASHGMGYAAAMALSGLDLALWDIRAKAVDWPLYKLLGGASKPIKAYAGGISLGYQPPQSLAQEALGYVAQGYRAVKLRVGDNPRDDVARATAVREAVGDEIEILVDANTGYTVDDVRRVMPAYKSCRSAGWKSRSRRRTTAPTRRRPRSAPRRWRPGKITSPGSSSPA